MTKLSHLAQIIVLLQSRELITAAELSQLLDVDKKTVYRYIDALIQGDIPVHTKKGRNGGFYIEDNFYIKEPGLNIEELQALMMAEEILTQKNGFYLESELKNAVAKIKNVTVNNNDEFNFMKDNKPKKARYICDSLEIDQNINKMNLAKNKGRTIYFDYYSNNANQSIRVNVDPYAVLFVKGTWRLIGYSHEEDVVRGYYLSRIRNVKLTENIFIRSAKFSLKEYLENEPGEFEDGNHLINIKFKKEAANFVNKNKWGRNQKTELLEDGSIYLKFFAQDLNDIKAWILGFGSLAEVIAPKELREEIIEEIEKIRNIYY